MWELVREVAQPLTHHHGCTFETSEQDSKGNHLRDALFLHNLKPTLLQEDAKEVFDAITREWVKVQIGVRFKLRVIANVHEAAESKIISGAIVINA